MQIFSPFEAREVYLVQELVLVWLLVLEWLVLVWVLQVTLFLS
jgi:hypothetical protein